MTGFDWKNNPEIKKAKEEMKARVKPMATSMLEMAKATDRLDKWEETVRMFAKKAADHIAENTQDESKVEELAGSARKGATYAAVNERAAQIAKDMLGDVTPIMTEFKAFISEILEEALLEATVEMVLARVRKLTSEG